MILIPPTPPLTSIDTHKKPPHNRQRLKELAAQAAQRAGDSSPTSTSLLRVEVESGGCSGFQYVFRLDASPPRSDDVVFERAGARVVVDAVSLGFLRGATLEYEDSLMRSAFHIAANPNSEASCGCGSSFTAKGG